MARRHKLHRHAAGNVDHIIEFDSFDDILSVGTEKIYEKCCKHRYQRINSRKAGEKSPAFFITVYINGQ